MPKVLEDTQNNLFVYIYTNDHTPAHVHVFKGRKNDRNLMEMKINIGNTSEAPSLVSVQENIKNKDVKAAYLLIARHQEMLLKKWREIHEP